MLASGFSFDFDHWSINNNDNSDDNNDDGDDNSDGISGNNYIINGNSDNDCDINDNLITVKI